MSVVVLVYVVVAVVVVAVVVVVVVVVVVLVLVLVVMMDARWQKHTQLSFTFRYHLRKYMPRWKKLLDEAD